MTDLTSPAPSATEPGLRGAAVAESAPATVRRLDPVTTTTVVVAVVVGALERLWVMVHTPLFADTAVVGLMGRQIEHGHVFTFYWSQAYGGVEPYVVAAVNDVVPGSFGLNLTSAALSGLAAVIVGLIVTELCADRRVGWLAGAMAWVWPYATLWNSTRELGFHFVSLCLGLLMIWLAIRVDHGHTGDGTFLALGLTAGLGVWSSPEVVYFVLPAAIVLVGSRRRWCTLRRLSLLAAGVLVGALPWLYTNARSGFASLSTGAAQVQGSGHRLSLFVHQYLPVALSLKHLFTGSWVGGAVLGKLLLVGAVVVVGGALVGSVWLYLRTGRELGLVACSVGVVTFPLLLAVNSKAEYWVDGRYGVDLSFLIVIVVFATAAVWSQTAPRALPRARHSTAASGSSNRLPHVLAAAVVAGVLLTVAQSGVNAQFASSTASLHSGFTALFSGWHDPDRELEASIADMHAAHIQDAYADYWTAYDIDYLDPTITASPSRLDVTRSQSLLDAVERSRQPAWLFSAPSHLAGADLAFGDQQGPGPYTESSFLAMLSSRGVAARVVHLGILDAVIPDRKIAIP